MEKLKNLLSGGQSVKADELFMPEDEWEFSQWVDQNISPERQAQITKDLAEAAANAGITADEAAAAFAETFAAFVAAGGFSGTITQ